MKKNLLFAVMLALGAAPAVATTATAAPVYASEEGDSEDGSQVGSATTEEYGELIDSIEAAITKLEKLHATIEAKYPESSVLGSLTYTISELKEMQAKATEAYTNATLTSDEVAKYQATVKEYVEGLADAEAQAALEEYQVVANKHYMAANDSVNRYLEQLDATVANHYTDAFYDFSADMNNVFAEMYSASTAEEFEAICAKFDSIADEAKTLYETAEAAAVLVKNINITLSELEEQDKKVQEDFPEYDRSYMLDAAEDWKAIVAEFAAAPAEGKKPYTAEEIQRYADNLEYFEEEVEGYYAQAQQDEFMAQFYEKYLPADTKLTEIMGTIDSECPNVKGTYYSQVEELSAELSNMYFQLYMTTPSKEEFAEMLARVDEIVKEAEAILAQAQNAEKIATGINGVSADAASSDADAYTLGGVRVNGKSAKGVVIINGKKVVKK